MAGNIIATDRSDGQRELVQDFMDEVSFAEMISRRMSAPRDQQRVVYFVADAEGPIKIGFTKNLKKRLSMLRTSTGRDLRVLATVLGGRSHELTYHIMFERHREEGEWFDRHPDILAEIERLNQMRPALREQSEARHTMIGASHD